MIRVPMGQFAGFHVVACWDTNEGHTDERASLASFTKDLLEGIGEQVESILDDIHQWHDA